MTVHVRFAVTTSDGETSDYEFRCTGARMDRKGGWNGLEEILIKLSGVERDQPERETRADA